MLNLPLIKWYVQELYELLKIDPNNRQTYQLYIQLETMLNSSPLNHIEAKAPDITTSNSHE